MARVRLFANLREIAGSSQVDIEGDTVGAVVDALGDRFGPEFRRHMQTARLWKNGDEGSTEDPVSDDDELAVIPPVSGGSVPGTGGGGMDGLLLAGLMLVLIVANTLDIAIVVAVWVGVVALWVIDLVNASSDSDFGLHTQPILASVLVSMAIANTLGLLGLGIGVAVSMVLVMGWAVVRPSARDLTSMGASALGAVIASLAVASLLLARSVADGGDRQVAGLLIVIAVGALVGRWTEVSRSRLFDPYLVGPVLMVVVAVAVAYLSGFDLLVWFFIGLLLACATIAGRGIGLAFRTGAIRLTARPRGLLAALDGPMLAVAVFVPVMRMIG
ncbi:MAG: MoaD/ThiS family protein [Acidimicrobiia bacterium]|nr:MoaD/ThiS family protein [Acidimicrobiia bacterium]MYF82653.1 MoaD/ThiS family protein [Acidimicrobiia bacterium]